MHRLGVVLLTLIAAMVFCRAAARAELEFCPGHVRGVEPVAAATAGSSTFQYKINALSPRLLDASIVADTDHGWYGWNVTGVSLRTSSDGAVSRPLIVGFPNDLVVRHAWITEAKTSGESVLHWDAQGEVKCEVPAFDANPVTTHNRAALPSPEPGTSLAAHAVPTAAPFTAQTCAAPFVDAKVEPAQAETPASVRDTGVTVKSVIAVAIGSDGKLIDAWTYRTSGYPDVDEASKRAARLSKYSSPISYCRHVPGMSLFNVMMSP